MITDKFFEDLLERVKLRYKTIIVDAFILSSTFDSILLQRRSNRKLFPGFWDAFGGHLEGPESIRGGLEREIFEESQLKLTEVIDLVHEFEWSEDRSVVNLQFLCLAVGNLKLEKDKVSEAKWVGESDWSAGKKKDQNAGMGIRT